MALMAGFTAVLLYMGACFAFAWFSINPRRLTYSQVLEKEIRRNHLDPQLANLPFTAVYCPAPGGGRLMGRLYQNPGDQRSISTGKYVLFFHGYNAPWASGLKYLPLLWRLGFHVLMAEQPGHGESSGRFITYGAREAKAGLVWLSWLEEQQGASLAETVVMGESMGAATALLTAAACPQIGFCIADCSYSSWREELLYQGKKRYGPLAAALIPGVGLWCRLLTGVSFSDVEPAAAARNIQCPVLLFHGDADTVVPVAMAQKIAEANPAAKLHIVKGAAHANAIAQAPEEYGAAVEAFLGLRGACFFKEKVGV